jgi:hypothetical protein
MVDYNKFVNKQDKILEHLEEHLQHTLSAFPKLSTITFCNSYWSKFAKFKFALREDSISRRWLRRNQVLALFRAIANTPSCNISKINVQGYHILKPYELLDNGDFSDDEHVPGSIKYCLGSTFEIAHYAKENIPFIHGSALSLTSEEVRMTQAIFSNLTHLNMGISTVVPVEDFYINPRDVPKNYWAEFPTVLKSLQNVVDLSLDMKVRRSVDQQHICFYFHDDAKELFENLQLPRLERLKLSQFRSCGSSVTSLLLKQPMLRDLSLNFIIEIETGHNVWVGNSWTPNPQWIQCIEVMRGLKLRRLHLQGIEGFGHCVERFGSENEDLTLSRIHDYILYGYGDMPLSSRTPDGSHRLAWDAEVNGLAWDAKLW